MLVCPGSTALIFGVQCRSLAATAGHGIKYPHRPRQRCSQSLGTQFMFCI